MRRPGRRKKAAEACLEAHQRGDDQAAWPHCKVYGDVSCIDGFQDEDRYKPTFELLRSANQGTDEWTCPDAYQRFRAEIRLVQLSDRPDAIKRMYPDPALAEAVNQFAADYGKGQAAMATYLAKHPEAPGAAQLKQHMDAADDERQKGHQLFVVDNLPEARVHYLAALAADEQVMSKGWSSNQAKAMRAELSDRYAERSRYEFTMRRFEAAYVNCAAGFAISHSNPAVLECLSTLENKAAALSQGSCDDLKLALKLTAPERLVHKAAAKKITEKCK